MNLLKKLYFLIYVITIFSPTLYAKIVIITHQCDRPMFIEWQYKTFKKFLMDKQGHPATDYEYIVFNDAYDLTIRNQIETLCNHYTIQCIPIPQELHDLPFAKLPYNPSTNASIRHSVAIQYSFDHLCFDNNDIVLMIDCDMLLIRPFNIRDFMHDCDIASAFRCMSERSFFWPGLVFFNMPLIPNKHLLNFDPGILNGHIADTGACTYHYIENHPSLRIKPIYMITGDQLFCSHDHDRYSPFTTILQENVDHMLSLPDQITILKKFEFNDNEIDLLQKKPCNIEFFLDKHFMHFRGIPTWSGINTQDSRFLHQIALCKEFITKILSS